ncbi:MAG: hypothetical protein Q9222_000701 [Ikaeria aurantiellina]
MSSYSRVSAKHFQSSNHCNCFRKSAVYYSALSLKSSSRASPRSESTPVGEPRQRVAVPLLDPGLANRPENEALVKAQAVLQSSLVPEEAVVETALQSCKSLAQLLSAQKQSAGVGSRAEVTPASSLLSLEEGQESQKIRDDNDVALTVSARSAAEKTISLTAYNIITDPKVFITPKLLSLYVTIQSSLGRPRSLPEIFRLYASKPVPKPNSAPKVPNPNKPSAHIPLPIADTALTAAIKSKDLPLCFDIVDYSVCARAFRNSKFFRKAFVPVSSAVLAPFAIYKLASELSIYQNTMDSTMATQVLFAGILAYVGFTATIGVVAVTTANDQMDRVTWAPGTPLRERWMREEERMLIDRIAGAWGFQQRSKRGEEEGPDWEALREWIGMRGMILDRTELMDGME